MSLDVKGLLNKMVTFPYEVSFPIQRLLLIWFVSACVTRAASICVFRK